MSTASKILPQPADHQLTGMLSDLVLAFNQKRQSILDHYHVVESDIEIIDYLIAHEQKKMKELGERFNIKLSTLTSIIDKLEKNKLVKRRNSKKDRRVIYIHLTSRASQLMDALENATSGIEKVVIDTLDEHEIHALRKGLDIIMKHLSAA